MIYYAIIEKEIFSTADIIAKPQFWIDEGLKNPLPYLTKRPSGYSNEIDTIEGKSTISGTNIEILNKNEYVSQWIYNREDSLYKKKVRLYVIENGSHVLLYSGKIESFEEGDSYGSIYKITIKDALWDLRLQTMFASAFDSTHVLPVVDGLNFNLIMYRGQVDTTSPNDYIDKDYIKYSKKIVGGDLTSFLELYYICNANKPNADDGFNTLYLQSKQENDGWDYELFLYCKCNPIEFAKRMSVYYCGESFVDVVKFDYYIAENSDLQVEFYFSEGVDDPFEFMSEKIYKILGLYPIITATGILTIGEYKQPNITNANEVVELNNSNIIEITNCSPQLEKITNFINVKDDHRFGPKTYKMSYYMSYDNSVAKYGELMPKEPITFELPIIIGDETAKTLFREKIKGKVFSRYGLQNQEVKLKVFYNLRNVLQIGKFVALENHQLIDWKGANAGKRGIVNDLSLNLDIPIINETTWGDYVWSNNIVFIGNEEILKVSSIIDMEFFNSIISNQNSINDFMIKQNRGFMDDLYWNSIK